ncbi:MAG: hypothetical protein ACREXR_17260, partial [Gammaproteobacteria bacterium]
LTVLVTPIHDVNGNGAIEENENGSIIKEGQSSFLKIGVNTPHTKEITLAIQFALSSALANLSVQAASRSISAVDTSSLVADGMVYVTLRATTDQENPNTMGLIRLSFGEESDPNNTASERLHYTVTAGYGGGTTFTPYSVFTSSSEQNLFILDNDTQKKGSPQSRQERKERQLLVRELRLAA